MFQFKQFTINDDRCAMKVGTDGVLLGAWAEAKEAPNKAKEEHQSMQSERQGVQSEHTTYEKRVRILDVGAGCGLISLMLAQRFPQAAITALELDIPAARQAVENVAESPFAQQVKVEQGDFLTFTSELSYDAIVSNPPFFEETLLPPDAVRASARHTAAGLTFESLVRHSSRLLKSGGSLQVIIPKEAQSRFHAICNANALTLVRATDVRTVLRTPPKRVLLHFVKDASDATSAASVVRDEIVLMENSQRTPQYTELCRDFYL